MKKTLIALLCILLFSCKEEPSKKQETKVVEKKFPIFNEDSSYAFIVDQVKFGPRVPGTSAHSKCADYLVSKLKNYGANVFIQEGKVKTFDGKSFNLKNIIASINPTSTERILLAAHWDTRPFSDQDAVDQSKPIDGANDGASGVAVLLEIARQIQKNNLNKGIDIIFFDVEDYGQPENSPFPVMQDSYCLGSQYWAKNPPSANYNPRYGILLDMVGGENVQFTQEEVSRMYASHVLEKVWKVASESGYSSYFLYEHSAAIIDDHYYVNSIKNIPMIDIIHKDPSSASGFWKHWHTKQDRLENIDKKSLKAVGQVVLNVLYTE